MSDSVPPPISILSNSACCRGIGGGGGVNDGGRGGGVLGRGEGGRTTSVGRGGGTPTRGGGAPQSGQAVANVLICLPHSEHGIRATWNASSIHPLSVHVEMPWESKSCLFVGAFFQKSLAFRSSSGCGQHLGAYDRRHDSKSGENGKASPDSRAPSANSFTAAT